MPWFLPLSFFFFFSSTFRLVESYFPNQRSNLTLAVKAWSPNHWPAREFPALSPLLNRTEFLLGASSDSSTLTKAVRLNAQPPSISKARLLGYPQMQHSGHNPKEALSGAFSIPSFQHCPVEFSVMMEIFCICMIQCGSHGIQYVLFESPLSM